MRSSTDASPPRPSLPQTLPASLSKPRAVTEVQYRRRGYYGRGYYGRGYYRRGYGHGYYRRGYVYPYRGYAYPYGRNSRIADRILSRLLPIFADYRQSYRPEAAKDAWQAVQAVSLKRKQSFIRRQRVD
jgi:hypothetical protein